MDYIPGTRQPLPEPLPPPLTPEQIREIRRRAVHYRGANIGAAVGLSEGDVQAFTNNGKTLNEVQLRFIGHRVGVLSRRRLE